MLWHSYAVPRMHAELTCQNAALIHCITKYIDLSCETFCMITVFPQEGCIAASLPDAAIWKNAYIVSLFCISFLCFLVQSYSMLSFVYFMSAGYNVCRFVPSFVSVEWLDHSKTLREQGIDPSETLLLRRKYFFSDQNVDARDPIQLNLLYVQVWHFCTSLCHGRYYANSLCVHPLELISSRT